MNVALKWMENKCVEEKLIDKIDSQMEMQMRWTESEYYSEIQHTICSWRKQQQNGDCNESDEIGFDCIYFRRLSPLLRRIPSLIRNIFWYIYYETRTTKKNKCIECRPWGMKEENSILEDKKTKKCRKSHQIKR